MADGIEPSAMSFSHKIGVHFLSKTANLFFHTNIKDFHCGLRAYNKEKIENLNLNNSGMEYASEMIIKAKLNGLSMLEVPTTLRKDLRDTKSHLRTIRDGFRHLFLIFNLARKRNTTKKKTIYKYSIIFFILIIIFNALLFATSLFPSNLIEENVKESSERLSKEGNYPYFFLNEGALYNNNYTDALMINECYSINNKNPILSYLSVRKNYKNGLTETELPDTNNELISFSSHSVISDDPLVREYDTVYELEEFLDGKVTTSVEYARYWHGYLPFLRVALIFLNITQIRTLLYVIFTILFIYFCMLVKKKLGAIFSIIFGISLLCITYFLVPYSLESSPVFLVMMVSSIILLKNLEKIKNIYTFIFIVACITNYVDFLTVPLITLVMPLYIYILYRQKHKNWSLKESLKIIFISTIIWALGYGLTWFSKWCIYDLIYNKNLISSAISQVLYRSSRNNNGTERTIQYVLDKFMKIYSTIIFCIASLEAIFLILFNAIFGNIGIKKFQIKRTKFKKYKNEVIPYLILSIYPFIWYVLLANHTELHVGFVYRNMLIFMLGILICIKKLFRINKL